MKVLLTPRAQGDLEKIGDFIGRDNPARAASFVTELEQCCLSLADYPHRHAFLPGHETSEVRKMSVRRYMILYRCEQDLIRIIRILHSAMDMDSLDF